MQLTQTQIKNGWKVVKLGEVAPYWSGKVDYFNLNKENYISADNMISQKGGIVNSEYVPVSGRSTSFIKGDTLISNIRPYFKKIWYAKYSGGCSNDVIVFRVSQDVNPRFVYYVLNDDFFFDFMMTGSNGTKMPRGDKRSITEYNFLLPPLEAQEKIAGVLGAYDDLIENNDKRIKVLEVMAQKLYTEWFVNFKFPGYEKVKMVDSGHPDFGLIPERWEVKNLSEITSVITKGTTPTTIGKNFCESGVNYIKIETIGSHGEILNDKFTFIDIKTHELLRRSKLEEFDILFSIAGAIGRTILVNKSILPANTNQALAIIRLIDKNYIYYIYQIVSSRLFLNFSTERIVQTAQANVSLVVIGSARILVPNIQVIVFYNETIKPIFSSIENLKNINQNLKKSRDFLIPQLVGGRMEVK